MTAGCWRATVLTSDQRAATMGTVGTAALHARIAHWLRERERAVVSNGMLAHRCRSWYAVHQGIISLSYAVYINYSRIKLKRFITTP